MKGVLFLLTMFVSSLSYSEYPVFVDSPELRDSWALGVGVGSGSRLESIIQFDIKSPRLFSWRNGNYSLVFNLEQKKANGLNESFHPMHLLFEVANNPYKGIIKAYTRVGPGMILINNTILHPDNTVFSLQAQFGVEVVTHKLENESYSTFFAQATLNGPAVGAGVGTDVFDATTTTLGVRSYF